jgi:hypothetical protein
LRFGIFFRNLTVSSSIKLEAAARGGLEPGSVCALNCVAQGSRYTLKMLRH